MLECQQDLLGHLTFQWCNPWHPSKFLKGFQLTILNSGVVILLFALFLPCKILNLTILLLHPRLLPVFRTSTSPSLFVGTRSSTHLLICASITCVRKITSTHCRTSWTTCIWQYYFSSRYQGGCQWEAVPVNVRLLSAVSRRLHQLLPPDEAIHSKHSEWCHSYYPPLILIWKVESIIFHS